MLVLALVVLAVCPTLHAWLHGEKQLDDDDGCAVVLFAHGLTPAVAAIAVLEAVAFVIAWKCPDPGSAFVAEPGFSRPPSCGPPA